MKMFGFSDHLLASNADTVKVAGTLQVYAKPKITTWVCNGGQLGNDS